MSQDSFFPPMLPPSTELGALLFAVLPCLRDTYRPLGSFAYHMTELAKLKNIPSVPSLSGLSGLDAIITDKDILLHSLSFYGKMFRMPLLSTIATLLQGMQFYQAYKDILPGLFSGMTGAGGDPSSAFGDMSGLSPDLFSILGGLSPDLLSSLFSGFSGGFTSSESNTQPLKQPTPDACENESLKQPTPATFESEPVKQSTPETCAADDTLYDTLYSFLTPEQQKIYEQLMHTD